MKKYTAKQKILTTVALVLVAAMLMFGCACTAPENRSGGSGCSPLGTACALCAGGCVACALCSMLCAGGGIDSQSLQDYMDAYNNGAAGSYSETFGGSSSTFGDINDSANSQVSYPGIFG